jgi:hypothetical protein
MNVARSAIRDIAMPFEDNFIVLATNRMVDPVLKIAVQSGRFNMEERNQWFDIEYDPELRPDRLWQKMPQEEIQKLIKFRMPRSKDDLIPFKSENIKRLLNFSISEKHEGDDLVLRLNWREEDFVFYSRLIAANAPEPPSSHADEFLAYVIRSMPKWYGLKKATPSALQDMKRLTFLVDKSFAQHLPGFVVGAFQEDGAGNIIVDRREIV